jgi:hypothetical protein
LNAGFSANLLRDIERVLKCFVETRTGMFVLKSKLVRLLKLAQDFSFAEDHGVKAAGDFEKMFEAVRFVKREDFTVERLGVITMFLEEMLQFLRRAIRNSVKLDAVASGEDHRFFDQAPLLHRLEGVRNGVIRKGKFLADRDRGGPVAQAYDYKLHSVALVMCWR